MVEVIRWSEFIKPDGIVIDAGKAELELVNIKTQNLVLSFY